MTTPQEKLAEELFIASRPPLSGQDTYVYTWKTISPIDRHSWLRVAAHVLGREETLVAENVRLLAELHHFTDIAREHDRMKDLNEALSAEKPESK